MLNHRHDSDRHLIAFRNLMLWASRQTRGGMKAAQLAACHNAEREMRRRGIHFLPNKEVKVEWNVRKKTPGRSRS